MAIVAAMASIPKLGERTSLAERPPMRGDTPADETTQGGEADAGRLRTRTLINLRWLAVAGQISTILITGPEAGRSRSPTALCWPWWPRPRS